MKISPPPTCKMANPSNADIAGIRLILLAVIFVFLSKLFLTSKFRLPWQCHYPQKDGDLPKQPQRPFYRDEGSLLPKPPLFYTSGITVEAQKAAHSTLKSVVENYRVELGLRMKALHDMVYKHLPGWEDDNQEEECAHGTCMNKDRPPKILADVTEDLQARMWEHFLKIPPCWQDNEDLLEELLRLPTPIYALPSHEQVPRSYRTPCSSINHLNTSFSSSPPLYSARVNETHSRSPSGAYTDAMQIFTHLYRDWTQDGQDVRRKTYFPILETVNRLFSADQRLRDPSQGEIHILVPGAGLGRLAFDLAYGEHEPKNQARHVTAMDMSPAMVAATWAVLGVVLDAAVGEQTGTSDTRRGESERREKDEVGGRVFHPFLHDPLLNQRTHVRRFYAASFPDKEAIQLLVCCLRRRSPLLERMPGSTLLHPCSSLALELGDFLQLAHVPAWRTSQDAVVTCFFLDTAPNPLAYLRVVDRLLRPGGYWINLGPLNYHHTLPQGALQLTLEELESVAEALGLRKQASTSGPLERCAYRPHPPLTPEGFACAEQEAFLRVDMYQPELSVFQKVSARDAESG